MVEVGAQGGGVGGARDGSDAAASTARTVPVAVHVAEERRERLSRLVEGALGWPVVDEGDPVLPPAALLVDVRSLGRAPRSRSRRLPVVLLVAADDDPRRAATAGGEADVVLPWPPSVDDLGRAVLRTPMADSGRPWCTVAGAAGGVGATAVAVALAGMRAWHTGRTLAAVTGPPHVAGAPVVARRDLASPAVWSAAVPCPGLDRLRVVALDRDDGDAADTGRLPTVLDVGVAGDLVAPDLLVLRPDRSGLDAAGSTPARTLVVVGTGPVSIRALRAAAGVRAVVPVRSDPRVAAACAAGRHPTDAPGSWLRPLAAVVAGLPDEQAGP